MSRTMGNLELLLNDVEATLESGGSRCSGSTSPAVVAADVSQFKLQYSRKEATTMLNIGLRTLDRLIEGKQITVRRVGRRVLITRDALEQFTKRDHKTRVM